MKNSVIFCVSKAGNLQAMNILYEDESVQLHKPGGMLLTEK
jgi:hypothetical protein